MMQKILLTSFLFLLPFLSYGQTQTITLEEAIEIALENNYQLKQAENNLRFSDVEVRNAQADLLPSVNASFNGTRRVGRQFDESSVRYEDLTTNSLSGSISSSVTLFNGFRNIMNLRRANTFRDLEREDSERLKEIIIFNTASSYLEVVLNEELLKISRGTLEASQSQLEQVQAQVEVGSRPTADLYNQESVVANDELDLIQRENALEISIAQLMRIMQDESDTDYEFSMPSVDELALIPLDLDLNEMIEAALNNRSDLKVQELQIRSNEYSEKIARASLLPTINLNAGINASYNDQFRGAVVDPNDPDNITREPVAFSDQFFDQNINRYIGFSVQIPIFDNLNNRTSLQNSQLNLRNSRLELENIRFQINEEIRQAYNDYKSVVKELESTEKALIAAERAFETEQQRYEVGSTTLIELNQANANYVQAQSNRVQAVYNFVFQEKLLDYYIGRLGDDFEFEENNQ